MTKAQIKQLYTERANTLRKAGFNVTLRGNKKPTPQQKSAVSRLYYKISAYTDENNFVFKKLKPSVRKKVSGGVTSQQLTPRGVFIQYPKGVRKKDVKINITDKGSLIINTPARRDEVLKLNPKKLAVNPNKEIREALKKRRPDSVQLQINGYGVKRSGDDVTGGISKSFDEYWSQLFQGLTDQDYRSEKYEETGEWRYAGRTMSKKEVADTFTLKLTYNKR